MIQRVDRCTALFGRSVVIAVLLTFLPLPVLAQPVQRDWDPERWLQLVREGDEYYNQAVEVPEENVTGYRALLTQSLRAKQEALEMLRRALLLNQVEEVERLWDEANRDLFNLNENVIVLLIELDQCTAAELILEQALREPEILPEGGPEHLQSLEPEIRVCEDRVAAESAPAFNYERYDTLLSLGVRWRDQAEEESDPEQRNANLYEASQNYGQALELLRTALLSGRLADPDGDYETDLYLLYNDLITMTLEMDLCAGAQRRIRQAVSDAEELPYGDPESFQARQPEIQECQERVLAASAPECVVDTDCGEDEVCAQGTCVERPAPKLAEHSETDVIAYILWGTAGATAITALVLDIVAGSDRDELESLQDACPDGPDCDYDRALDLSDSLNNRKVTIAVLASASIVTAVVGTILFFTSESKEEAGPPTQEEARAGTPVFEVNGLGASVRINF